MSSLLQGRRSPEANQTLHDLWLSPGLVHYIHLRGLLPRDGILLRAEFTLRPSLAFSYIGSVTARHSSSRHQPNFVAWYKEWDYGNLEEGATYIRLGGHHVGHRPRFYFYHFFFFLRSAVSAVFQPWRNCHSCSSFTTLMYLCSSQIHDDD